MADMARVVDAAVFGASALNSAGVRLRRLGEIEAAEVCFAAALEVGRAMGEEAGILEDRRLAELIAVVD